MPERNNTHDAKKKATNLSQVVKVVLMVNPLVVGLHTVRLVGNVFDIGAEAVEELAFKQLSEEQWHQAVVAVTYKKENGEISLHRAPR